MRLRNIKNADEILKNSKYYIESAEKNRGKWQEVFHNDHPIVLEIGMGKGDFLTGMATIHPEWNFIGIEKYESVMARGLEKLSKTDLKNVKVVMIDAINLANYFDREVTHIYLNFSDPWPKKRHHKRRLTHESFLKVYDKISNDYTKLFIKTDNDGLFESTLINLNNYGYIFDDVVLDLWSKDVFNIKTEYEIKFSSKGYKIKYIEAHKKR